jgi:hypothetical protein
MPVAAKFSEGFYQKFGHEATGELVEYLNTIDDTYRAELQQLNDANRARFEARLDQRTAEIRADMRVGFAELESRLRTHIATGLAALESRLLKWMFRLWLGSTITTVGLVLTVVGLLR